MQAKDIMSSPVVTATPETPLKWLAALLLARGISSVPVVDASGSLIGIVSETDLLALEVPHEPEEPGFLVPVPTGPGPHRVGDAMSHPVVAASADADAGKLARLMLERGLRHVPITADGVPIGMIARIDLLKLLVRSDEEIEQELTRLVHEDDETGSPLTVRVSGGVVTFNGWCDQGMHKQAERLARSIPGVLDVVFTGEQHVRQNGIYGRKIGPRNRAQLEDVRAVADDGLGGSPRLRAPATGSPASTTIARR